MKNKDFYLWVLKYGWYYAFMELGLRILLRAERKGDRTRYTVIIKYFLGRIKNEVFYRHGV